jgi:carboxylate-amine ligase
MVLDTGTLDLAERAADVLAAAGPDTRFKPELVAAQMEIVTEPSASVGEAIAALAGGRRALAAAARAAGGLRLACAGAHPFAATEGALTPGARYEAIAAEYGTAARRQLISALQVHVAVGGAARALAVYNALRSYLPELAALAAHAPFHGGRDTGLASVRPTIAQQLPRQGIPPVLESWDAYAAALRAVGDPGAWWWELRPHPLHGTLELRVPDAQATVADAGAVAAVAHALVVWLAGRHEAGEPLPVAETRRIEENRRSALRHGPAGTMTDPHTDHSEPTAERIARLLDELAPVAADLGCAAELRAARALLAAGGPAARLRAAAGGDVRQATEHLARCFLDGTGG